MELEYIKSFLKVDFEDDDEMILLLSETATKYIEAATGKCNYSDPRVKLLALAIITELYEKRSFSVERADEKAQYAIRSIISQLQAEEYLSNES